MVEGVYPHCAGLDVHKKSVVACRMLTTANGRVQKEVRTFGTMTADLLELSDWLQAAGVTTVAMESTGVYWKPIWNLLEEPFDLFLVNAQHIKTVPGRKTDVKDSEWIADLLRHGLLRKSFVPDRPGRELRELTRYRRSLVQERTAEVNRLQKTLEGANIKLAAVASEVLGVSGRHMLEGLLAGVEDPQVLAQFAQKALRKKIPELERALAGRFGAHQRFLVARQLAHIDALDELITEVSGEIAERLRPFDHQLDLLDTLPGIGRWSAEVLLAELGTDMSRFPTAGHLVSWAGLCPGHHESAGKRQSGKTRKGSKALRVTLTEAAYAAGRGHTYVSAQYHRLVRRRGRKKAAVAVAHTLLEIAYHVLCTDQPYRDLGADYFVTRDRAAEERRLVRRLEALGHTVTLHPRSPTAEAA